MRTQLVTTVFVGVSAALVLACQEPSGRAGGGAFLDHEESSDLVPFMGTKADGVLEQFDPDLIVSDALFLDGDALTVEAVQALLETSPYGKRCFLADEVVGGRPFSQALVEVATAREINPVLLLVRLQVEKSLVSKSTRPGGNSVDFALGCGCPDGTACNEAFRGIDRQLDCGADTLRKRYEDSLAGRGVWAVDKTKKSLDPVSVTPQSHGTASLYAYTPWVLEGKGGNWLVWNVTRKYLGNLIDRGLYDAEMMMGEPTLGSCMDQCGSVKAIPQGDGRSCFCDAECGENDDCCDDYYAVCEDAGTEGGSTTTDPTDPSDATSAGDTGSGPSSCFGACGSSYPQDDGAGSSCYCDDMCVENGDCCPDYPDACGNEPDAGSCAGICGSTEGVPDGEGLCYCDESCASNQDCCGDYDFSCG